MPYLAYEVNFTLLPWLEYYRSDATFYLLVEVADGYKAMFALPELDPAFTDRIILLADRRDDKPLSREEERLRVVVPDEKRQARWVRQVITLIIKRAE